ncbi:hypothetical protein HYDPIDRAFT_31971 [Hydnomerulius pinastri MD-312]|uniref:Poly(A) RNA polymerase mitochondrial-like central palm domain-containing protein n=1 Tax=Hydnomerulius pinastri MD-312 TaxID=994086 RepID=A0A0C9V5F8_9AGAM|nr:hypothetical protein HYDPIDRAFT_31971 [Hydnomerulius pinastri MD-312]
MINAPTLQARSVPANPGQAERDVDRFATNSTRIVIWSFDSFQCYLKELLLIEPCPEDDVPEDIFNIPQTQSLERLSLRHEVAERLSNIIRDNFGKPYKVKPFGSTVYMRGFRVVNPRENKSKGGDLDLVMLDLKRPRGFSPDVEIAKLPGVYNVWKLAGALQRNRYTSVQPIPKANVPIVKFYDPRLKLHMDINVNDRLGLINSYMIQTYCDLLPGLRSVIAAIKLWAGPLGLNAPGQVRGRPVTFSTYALTLMTLGWLQSRGLAPFLQDNLEALTGRPGETLWLRTSKKTIRTECDVRFRKATIGDLRPPLDLQATMLDWFHFWGYEYEFKDNVIDAKEGGIYPRPSLVQPSPISNDWEANVDNQTFDGIDDDFGLRSSESIDGPAMDLHEHPSPHEQLTTEADGPPVPEEGKTKKTKKTKKHFAHVLENSPIPHTLQGPICVIDPFHRRKNITKNISAKTLKDFCTECQRSWERSKAGTPMYEIIQGFEAFEGVEEPRVDLPKGPADLRLQSR